MNKKMCPNAYRYPRAVEVVSSLHLNHRWAVFDIVLNTRCRVYGVIVLLNWRVGAACVVNVCGGRFYAGHICQLSSLLHTFSLCGGDEVRISVIPYMAYNAYIIVIYMTIYWSHVPRCARVYPTKPDILEGTIEGTIALWRWTTAWQSQSSILGLHRGATMTVAALA